MLTPMFKITCRMLLAASLLVASCSTPDAPPKAGAFDSARAWSDLETIVAFGPRPSGTPANALLRDFIDQELTTAGLTVTREPFTSETPAGEVQFENLYADIAPAKPDAPWIILCTHFDTKPIAGIQFLGANDGGSGTAILLELARILAAKKEAPKAGIRILFLDGEEAVNFDWEGDDNTYGSRHHAAQLAKSQQAAKFGACVLLDMLGDKDLQLVHETYSRRELMGLFENQATRLGLGKYMNPQAYLPVKDDHLSFAKIGIPAIDLIDFEYGPQNSYWHTDQDTLEHCSQTSLAVAGRLVLGSWPALEKWVTR